MKTPGSLNRQLAEWNDGAGISPSNWICCVGRYDHFVGYARLIWPELLEYQGRVYIRDFFDEVRLAEAISLGVSPRAAQAMHNAIDVSQIFASSGESVGTDQVVYLASVLQQTWSAKLERDFPSHVFQVHASNSLNEPGIGELLVTFSEA